MSARKLQQEMERVFKRVAEGCSVFDNIYNKLQGASNQSQKEKLEQDLKREIKKLQKLRDQIKTWIASNDVRDKKQLMEQRRLIENDMERFKVVEREIKTKAYSKEGLSRANDPYAKEKQEATDFLTQKSEELEQQIEELEEELEQLQTTTKKGKKDSSRQDLVSKLDHTVERHKWHLSKMEIMVNMIESDKLAPESVMDLQDDINYYVESNQDGDFQEDEAMYDDLNLIGDDDTEIVETIVRDDTYSLEDLAQDLSKEAAKEAAQKEREEKEKEKKEKEKEKEKPKSTPSAGSAHSSSQGSAVHGTPGSHGSGVLHGNSARDSSHPPGLGHVQDTKTPSPRRSQSPNAPGLNPLPAPSVPATRVADADRSSGGGHLAQGGATAPTPMLPSLATKTGAGPASSTMTAQTLAAQSNLSQAAQNAADVVQAASPAAGRRSVSGQSFAAATDPNLNTRGSAASSQTSAAASSSHISTSGAPGAAGSSSGKLDIRQLPPGLQDLVKCFDSARTRLNDPEATFRIPSVAKLVHDSFLATPDAALADVPRYYHPQNPYPTPDYYPQEALPSLEDPLVFREMHVDTLFYVFYYCRNTYQQYLAAKELKSRSWRFHKQFLTWFQRQEDPEVITADYEEGTYRFFDFEGSWVQRRKTNFKFEFKYLENEI